MCGSSGGGDKSSRECVRCGNKLPARANGPGRPRAICDSCRSPKRRTSCERCGNPFPSDSGGTRRFCGGCARERAKERTRASHGRVRPPIRCIVCGVEFAPTSARKTCGEACAAMIRGRPAVVYDCLYCKKTFQRKRYRSGNISCGKKYCSRKCAFAARGEKLPCAARPGEIAAKMRRVLSSWRKERDKRIEAESRRWAPARTARIAAMSGPKLCRGGCGAEVPRGKSIRFCPACSDSRAQEARRRQRKRRRQERGSDSYRARCRRVNAPYTPIKKTAIYDRDNWTCQICGVELLRKYLRTSAGVDTRSPTLDHIVPLCLGPDGPGHVESNVHAACWDCNTRRGAMPLDSFAAAASDRLR